MIETDGLSQHQIKQLDRVSKIINGEPITKQKQQSAKKKAVSREPSIPN